MSDPVKKFNYSELDIGYIVLKKHEPTIITKEILLDLILDDKEYSPITITSELLNKLDFHETKNNFSKEVYYDLGNTIARIIYDGNKFRLNCRLTIKSGSNTITDPLMVHSVNQLQSHLNNFYGLKINPENLLHKLKT